MWTLVFWKDSFERALKTFAQVLALALTTGVDVEKLGLVAAPWGSAISLAGMAFVLSVLTSLASALVPTGPQTTPSLVDVGRAQNHDGD